MKNAKMVLWSAAVVGLVGLLGGCESKITQCNKLIDEANKSQETFTTLGSALGDKDKMAKAVEDIKGSAEKVKGIELKDEKLVGFKDRWVEGLEGMAGGLEKMSDEKLMEDPTKLKELSDSFTEDGEKMSKLIDEINGYCQGG